MKKNLFLIVAAFIAFAAQTTHAQEPNYDVRDFHIKVTDSSITPVSFETDILEWVAKELKCELVPNEYLIPGKSVQDKNGRKYIK